MSQAEPVRIGISPSQLAELVLQCDQVLDELEVVDAGTELEDYAARRFWHAHANLEGVRNTLAEWLGPLEPSAADQLRSDVSGPGRAT